MRSSTPRSPPRPQEGSFQEGQENRPQEEARKEARQEGQEGCTQEGLNKKLYKDTSLSRNLISFT